MANEKLADFHQRLNRIETGHRALSTGYVKLEERDGQLVPVRTVRPRRGFPWRGLFLVLLVFILFKAILLAHMGPIRYVQQHAKLEEGSVVDRMGAWALRPDPATVYIAGKLEPYMQSVTRLTSF